MVKEQKEDLWVKDTGIKNMWKIKNKKKQTINYILNKKHTCTDAQLHGVENSGTQSPLGDSTRSTVGNTHVMHPLSLVSAQTNSSVAGERAAPLFYAFTFIKLAETERAKKVGKCLQHITQTGSRSQERREAVLLYYYYYYIPQILLCEIWNYALMSLV